ncbi:MAG: exopolysaccharide biosynthesis polyprenyl glycosylphosphotransferase [Trueperaceae bacterium]|nr:exopolysaccharide biosynthesis polyprenyl glycosylphosphotransferase [Trueperaceae bacterium]MCW5819507.1 exopolysaccharide biosynthesis polyprenyl glycosylphosphotransferase [Trueperaceae bacterium]
MAALHSTSRMQRGAAFLAGVSFAAVPAVGPFIAIAAIFAGRLQVQRADTWWWLAGLLLGAPYLLTGHPLEGALASTQVLAVWLIFRSATEFRRNARSVTVSEDIGAGLVVGLVITLVFGLRQISAFRFDLAQTFLDAIAWNVHPAIFGHAILVLSALLAIVVPSPQLRVISLGIGAVGVIVSGAGEAVWAWLAIALGLQFVVRRGTTLTRAAERLLIAVMLLFAFGVPARLGLGTTGLLTDFAPQKDAVNEFRGTELAKGDWWVTLGVAFTTRAVTVAGTPRTAFDVRKTSTESWSRLQQVVTLLPGETYTLSAAIHAPEGARPGFDGWGREAVGQTAANLGTVLENEVHRTTATGPITVISSSALELDGGWVRTAVTFRFEGERPLTWYVGVVPDRSSGTGVTTSFAELQLVSSYALLPYRPGPAARGVTDLRTSRLPIWRDALEAVSAKPLLGWGPGGFPLAVTTLHPDETLLRPVAAHAHNSFLAVWVDRGLIGLLGLVGLFALLALRAVQQRDQPAAAVLLGVLILNLFDATLLSGAVIYPLAAVLGWRAVGRREVAEAETGVGSATAVRLGLALADAVAGAGALSLGMYVAGHFDPGMSLAVGWRLPLVYATLAWPAVAAAAGLYPGYGLPSYRQLSRSVRAAFAAAVAVGFIALLLPDVFGLTAPVFFVAVPAATALAPVIRFAAQKALQRLRLWGRPVVVIGTEPATGQVTRHLLAHPDIGLHPIAVFGERGSWPDATVAVSGTLEEAWKYIDTNEVRHAIIGPTAASSAAFDRVLLQPGNRLKYVQFLPDLRGLPTNSVVATPLGATLGLEVRNQLASGTNRAVKRITDFLGASLLLLVLGLPLLVVALLIRLDSRGPALYLSPRIGRYGKTFACVKFRTMHVDADERLQTLLSEHPELREEYEHFHKLENDPRVTRVGRVLRRVSLDELPQLLNVMRGQMSLVGPRPYMERERKEMGGEQDIIFLARPGMTGYWQTEARNDVSFAERQAMEAHYVRNWSVWWDVDILLRTPAAMLDRAGK